MVKNCCVTGCKSFWYPNTNLSFFRFPLSNKQLLDKWLEVVSKKSPIGKYSYICSEHFNESDFYYTNVKRALKKNAVPSRFTHDTTVKPVLTEKIGTKEVIINAQDDENSTSSTFSIHSACEISEDTINKATIQSYNTNNKITLSQPKKEEILIKKQSEMRRKIRNLENRLRYREAKLRLMTDLIMMLTKKDKCTKN